MRQPVLQRHEGFVMPEQEPGLGFNRPGIPGVPRECRSQQDFAQRKPAAPRQRYQRKHDKNAFRSAHRCGVLRHQPTRQGPPAPPGQHSRNNAKQRQPRCGVHPGVGRVGAREQRGCCSAEQQSDGDAVVECGGEPAGATHGNERKPGGDARDNRQQPREQ